MIDIDTKDNSKRWNRALAVGCVFFSFGLGGILYTQHLSYFNPGDFGPLFGTASFVILHAMFGLYQYAYVFYEDVFYQFLSVAWLLNAVYICFETFFKPDQTDLKYHLQVYALGLLTLAPLHIARFKQVEGPLLYRKLAFSSLKWLIWLISTFLFCYWLTGAYLTTS